MSALFSFSALERVAACPASAALPHVFSESSASSARGNVIHAFLCAILKGIAREAAIAAVPIEFRNFCTALPPPSFGRPELAFAWDYTNGKVRILGEDIGRAYEVTETEIPGSADIVLYDRTRPEITDYKSGFLETTPPVRNLQLGALAVCAARNCGAQEALVRIRKVTESAEYIDSEAVLDAFDLAAVEETMRTAVHRIRAAQRIVRAGGTPDVTEGEHCRWCPARNACPAKVSALVQLRTPDGLATQFQALLGEDATRALELYERAEEAMKTIRSQLYGYARTNPITTSDGKVFGPVETTREQVDASKAWLPLHELGPEVAADALEMETSKAAIERALVKHGHADKKKSLLAQLRELGAITSKTTESIRKHTAKEK